MKHRLSYLILFILFCPTVGLRGQSVETRNEAECLSQTFAANYDSLLNSYVMRKYARTANRQSRASFDIASFDLLPDTVIAQRLRSLHTVIPMTYNAEVRAYIRMYLRKMSSRLDATLTLCEYYHPIFEESLARWNVPEELKYLTIVESAMNPMATSRVGAAGLWQFMYSTGKNYNLEVNSIIDERRDPYKSSEAAAHYIHDLHRIFDDWTLAIAAYNCGPGNINKAIARSGGKRNFWDIYYYLPRETRGYIPAFIAATYVMKFYPEHGLRPGKYAIPLRTDTVMVERDMFFCYVSQYIDMDIEELRSLNPQYRADFIPGASGSFPLCLPNDKMTPLINMADSIFLASEDSVARTPISAEPAEKAKSGKYSSSSSNSVYHKVKRGETLTKIANSHGVSVAAIKKMNKLKSDRIHEGQRLRVR